MEDPSTLLPQQPSSYSSQSQSQNQLPSIPKSSQITINVACTKYILIRKLAKLFKWKITRKQDDQIWDIFWTDSSVLPQKLSRMKAYQKINHFPGMHAIARKNQLAMHLNRIRKFYPRSYNFYPKTWLIPSEYADLKIQSKTKKIYIVKPEASCQGRGIFLTQNIQQFSLNDRFVIQEYIQRPLLIDRLKFDLRIYVLLAGCDPLRIYLHQEGLARFATIPYRLPKKTNLAKSRMHLTNYAINKTSEEFVYNQNEDADDIGHKRSLTSTFQYLKELGYDSELIWEKIKDLIIKTLCVIQPSLTHIYKACQPDQLTNSLCFQILGFDVLIDKSLKPWLLQVNHSPSFNIDSPLDRKIKEEVLKDAFSLLKIKSSQKANYKAKLKSQLKKRSQTKKHLIDREQRELEIQAAQASRDRWQNTHLGGYTKIFPVEGYQKYLQYAHKMWEEQTGTKSKARRPQSSREKIAKTPSPPVKEIQTGPKRSFSPGVFTRLSRPKQVLPKVMEQQIVIQSERDEKSPVFLESIVEKPSSFCNVANFPVRMKHVVPVPLQVQPIVPHRQDLIVKSTRMAINRFIPMRRNNKY